MSTSRQNSSKSLTDRPICKAMILHTMILHMSWGADLQIMTITG